ncbi:MAG: UDP-N-acetylmuramoyl-L-alanyl-D-glutamate--2,6-diaminopimelate ligase [Oscillospiraceae bacterium]|nr:UDP-N-acetylmuramoyl-L-alanyl-D-glutamate--2,6-diaminopimelate ligase [Oscillospiraceae bacterium]
MKIRDLLKNVPHTLLQGSEEAEVTGLCHDNRRLQPGDAFICITGARFDTHDLTAELARAGASLIVTQRDVSLPGGDTAVIRVDNTRRIGAELAAAFYDYPAQKLTTVAITGTKGKTTSTHMMGAVLRAAGFVTGTMGSSGAILPDAAARELIYGAAAQNAEPSSDTPGYVRYKLTNTTPDAMDVQMYLAMMVASGCTHAVVEVSSQAMKQYRVEGITFDYGIWTNIETGDHIGPAEHKNFDEYLCCKAALMNHCREVFLNGDDRHAGEFLARVREGDAGLPERIFTFGQNADADYHATNLRRDYDENSRRPGIRFALEGLAALDVQVNLPGSFNMYNALAVCAVASRMGVGEDAMHRALGYMHVPGRFDIVFDNGHFRVCVDSAHSGYSVRSHLQGLREYRPKRLVCVFGAGGNRAIARRFEMGEASAELADVSIVTSEHNRFEPFETICADILTGIRRGEEVVGHGVAYQVIPDRKEAIRYAITHAQEGDMITILGLGSDTYQEENGVKHPHSDKDFTLQTARELGLL